MLALGVDPDTHYPSIVVVCLDTRDVAGFWQGSVPRAAAGEQAMLEAIRQMMAEGFPSLSGIDDPTVCVVEGQQVYPRTPLGASGINGLLRLSAVGGSALAMCARCWPDSALYWPLPAQWTGGAPKQRHQQRTYRALSSAGQRAIGEPTGRGSHLIDAAGLALWAGSASRRRRDRRSDILQRARKRRR